ncbi:hypothetical protein ACFWMJ_03045 [Streptomyces hawaiiensis]
MALPQFAHTATILASGSFCLWGRASDGDDDQAPAIEALLAEDLITG